jgi:hypothetical protein
MQDQLRQAGQEGDPGVVQCLMTSDAMLTALRGNVASLEKLTGAAVVRARGVFRMESKKARDSVLSTRMGAAAKDLLGGAAAVDGSPLVLSPDSLTVAQAITNFPRCADPGIASRFVSCGGRWNCY